MILEQHYLTCLSQASYFLGDEESKTAIVVDPRRDVDVYIDEAKKLGLEIRLVVLTHFHADFLAGHLELRERTGAEIALGRRAVTEFPFRPLREGDDLVFGNLRLAILETPGHTPESVCILVYDLAQSNAEPRAVLTGDTLFIGDVGRPDLLASVGATAEELAGMMYDSLREKLLPLSDAVLVYPGHGAGSACGRNIGKETVSTLGEQRRLNYALRPMSKERFVELLTAPMAAPPAYFAYDAQRNREEHPTLAESLRRALRPLSLAEVLKLANAGAMVLDVRDPSAYAAAHLRGSLSIGLDGKYASWAGTVIPPETLLVLVTDPGREEEAAMRLGRIGYDRIAGYLDGGADAFASRSDLVRSVERIDAAELARRLASRAPPRVVDVRGPGEYAAGYIEGALSIPLPELSDRAAEIPRDRPFVLHCAGGYRSMIAASLLERRGVTPLTDLTGGFNGWQQSGQRVVQPSVR